MYPQQGAAMAPPQKPETFMLSNEAQQSLPQDAQVALQQVDNRECPHPTQKTIKDVRERLHWNTVKYFLISAPVDWTPDSLIRRFLLPTGEYVSCVLW
jgi:transcription factor STE12